MTNITEPQKNYIISDRVWDELFCKICDGLMVAPIQNYYGSYACRKCYDEKEKLVDENVDPINTNEPRRGVIKDLAKETITEAIIVKCAKTAKCDWEGSFKDFQDHECKIKICQYCNLYFDTSVFEHHMICEQYFKVGKCTIEGCDFESATIDEAREHHVYAIIFHFDLMLEENKKLKQDQAMMSKTFENKLARQARKHKDELYLINAEIKSIKAVSKIQIDALTKNLNTITNDFNNKINALEQRQPEPIQNQAPTMSVAAIKQRFKNVKKTIDELGLRQQLSENTNYDGTTLWKIDGFQNRTESAIAGRTTALHSAPIFMSRYGYKFCIRIYLNGDGLGAGTHLSVFIVVMKSEYDSLLKWPLKAKFTLELINNDISKSFRISFDSDPDSSSFKKPDNEMNIAFGDPKFISLEMLREQSNGFIMDDSLFINTTAEITN